MTDDLPFDAAELFRSARAGLSPSTDALARGRRRLASALAAGGAATGGAAVAKAAGLSGSAVLATVVAGTLAVTGGAAWWHARPVAATAPPLTMPSLETGASLELTPKVAPSTARELAPTPAREVAPEPAHSPDREVVRMPTVQPAPADELSRELELVRTADAALGAGDANTALAITRADHVVQLAAELSAIEIDALCALGRHDEARERVDTFRQRFPYSALAERVARSCEGGKR